MATAPVIPIQTPRLALWQIIETIDAYVDTLELIESDAERIEAEAELDSYLSQLARKVDTTTEFLDFIEARREIRKKQVQRLESSNRRDQAIIDRIERSITRVIESTGRESLEGDLYSFRLRKCPASVDVLDQSLVPAEYIREKIEYSVDKTAAKPVLKAKVQIPGLALITDRKSVVRS